MPLLLSFSNVQCAVYKDTESASGFPVLKREM